MCMRHCRCHRFVLMSFPVGPPTASSASRTRTRCVIVAIPVRVPALTSSNYKANSQMRRVLSRGQFVIAAFQNVLCSVFPHLFDLFLHSPPLVLSPLFPSLSLHSLVSGWKVQWGCGIPEGQGEGGRWRLPLTRARACVCVCVCVCVCAKWGLLISHSDLSAVAGGHIQKILNIKGALCRFLERGFKLRIFIFKILMR